MISNVITVKLKKLLEERGMSIFQLHKETAITYPTLHKIASGKGEGISFKVLEKLCENLGCFPSDLLLYESNTTPQTAKTQKVKVDPKKPASKPETLKKPVSSDGMTVGDVRERLGAATGKKLSRERISNYITDGTLRTTQPGGKGTPHSISEADYLEFEAWYKANILQSKKL
jgi:DNA-binding Xre family transcriptional regulator